MIFLGEEWFVKDWDDADEILKLAKGRPTMAILTYTLLYKIVICTEA